MSRLTLRLQLGATARLGPGKVRLLEHIRDTGSIAAAGRAMGMSYRRAWLLVDSLNRCFRQPVVTTKLGGRSGGGAELTDFGDRVVREYRDMEAKAEAAVARHLALFDAALAEPQEICPAAGRRTAPA